MTPEERLAELGHELPEPNPPVANYVGAVTVGNLVFVSGHGPYREGSGYVFTGKLGREVDVETGQKAAELTIVNLLASLKAEIGELGRVRRVVKLLVMVNSDPEFGEQPKVANGASDLLVEIFGPERGPHARSAVGMGALPFAIPVEIEGIFEIA
jgi:enamine deaminase RidA (YjgF/YER057c/UK114 family)